MVARLGSDRALKICLILLAIWVWGSSAAYLSKANRGPRDPRWKRWQNAGILRVGVDPSIAPFGIWTEDSQVSGFDVDLARALGEQTGLDVHITPLTYDGFYDALLLDRVDIVIATLRPDRVHGYAVRYTSPYFDGGHVLVSREGLASFKELDGKILAVELASNGDLAVRNLENVTVQRRITAVEALDAALTGDADAALVDNVTAILYLAEHDGLKVSPQTLLPDPYIMAVRRDEWRLYYAIENALIVLKDDGTLEKLMGIWLTVP